MRSSVPATNAHSKSISVATNHARSEGHHKPLTGGLRRPARAPQAAGHAAGSARGRARRSGRRRGSAGAERRPSRCTRRRRRHRASWLPLGGARPTRVRSPRRVARPPGGPVPRDLQTSSRSACRGQLPQGVEAPAVSDLTPANRPVSRHAVLPPRMQHPRDRGKAARHERPHAQLRAGPGGELVHEPVSGAPVPFWRKTMVRCRQLKTRARHREQRAIGHTDGVPALAVRACQRGGAAQPE